MTINKTNTNKNAVELRNELQTNGTNIEYVVVNGQNIGMLGTSNEKDRENAMKAIQTALDASGGSVVKMMEKLNTIATIEENEIAADEMVEVCGEEIILSYEQKKAYTIDGEEVANCTDLTDIPNEAIKALLIARTEVALSE